VAGEIAGTLLALPKRTMTIRNCADLIAWQKSMSLAESVYKTTRELPREEQYGLISQMRRAAVSIPSNIAEGEGRGSDGHFLHGLMVSYGSLRERETQLLLSKRLQFLKEAETQIPYSQLDDTRGDTVGPMRCETWVEPHR
jgi:four helix bundle protein